MYESTFSTIIEDGRGIRTRMLNSSDFSEEWKDSIMALSKQFPRNEMLMIVPYLVAS